MATSTVMQTFLASPVASSLVKNRSRVSNLFSATYVPRLRGSASKRVQCKAELVSNLDSISTSFVYSLGDGS
jgi:hypothetical protein